MRSKILSASQVDEWVAGRRAAGQRVGYTCGAFDILHAGHVDYLERARSLCDALLVAVNSDRSIQRYKNPLRPYQPEAQRMAVIAGLAAVDAVTLLEDLRPAAQLERWKPDLYIKGGDYDAKKLRSAPLVEAYGGKAVVLPVAVETSTTRIVETIAAAAVHAPPPPEKAPRKIVFLDRDGTLIRDVPFLHEPEQVELLPGVGEALAGLQALGFALVIVTNQQGIGLGYYGVREFMRVNQALFRQLEPFGVRIARVFFCPHSMADQCACRKPGTLLLEQALQWYGARADACYLIGDRRCDAEAAAMIGCRAVLLGPDECGGAAFRAADFAAAAQWIREQP